MKIGIKLLTKDATIPTKGTTGAAAYDLIVPTKQLVKEGRNIIKLIGRLICLKVIVPK